MLLSSLLALVLVSADPVATDSRLVIERFAAEPDIVTPTGIAVDAKGGVLVIESHTHFRPQGYKGPPADRIRRFEDTNHDGKADKITTVFEGTRFTMSLAVDADGSLVVATRNELFRLRDLDADGTFENKKTLAKLETPGDYPHNGLSGVLLVPGGSEILFGLGENLGAEYKLVGSDGKFFAGGGEGGNIYRCGSDGANINRVATGFWNPFALAFDAFGRLFAVDNDPDSRPPCRLLHIVDGGDYGYRFRNGRKGLHPFTAWNGELPGTLPMVAGTGEAPSGLLIYESDNLPDDYRGTVLSTSWGDHRIERFRLEPRGASFRSRAEPIVTGGDNFRPVGIALAPDGSIYISDWVDQSYDLHGKGRVWHLRAAAPRARITAAGSSQGLAHPDLPTRRAAARALLAQGEGEQRILADAARSSPDARARAVALEALLLHQPRPASITGVLETGINDPSPELRAMAAEAVDASTPELGHLASDDREPSVRAAAIRRLPQGAGAVAIKALESDDPFLQTAARNARALSDERLAELAAGDNAGLRVQALVALNERSSRLLADQIASALEDKDARVRFVALEWVAEHDAKSFRGAIERQLASGATSRQLFEAYLAALARLDGELRLANQEIAGEDYVARLLLAPKTSRAVRTRALRMLRPSHAALTLARLKQWLSDDDTAMQVETVRTLRESPLAGGKELLAAIANDAARPAALRAEAIVGLRPSSDRAREELLGLATNPVRAVRHEALRSLRGADLSATQRERLIAGALDTETGELVARISSSTSPGDRPAPSDRDGWLNRLGGPADPAEGERIFYHPNGPGCFRCHAVDGRGGTAGPDLTTTGQVLDRWRLVESILEPSKEIAPQFVPWSLAKTDGTVSTGLLVDEAPTGDQVYVDAQGLRFALKPSEIADRRPQNTSIMPADLHRSMTTGEFRDLIAFLQSPHDNSAASPVSR
jgi:putative membrane-bound dehydrogenase-like protein